MFQTKMKISPVAITQIPSNLLLNVAKCRLELVTLINNYVKSFQFIKKHLQKEIYINVHNITIFKCIRVMKTYPRGDHDNKQ